MRRGLPLAAALLAPLPALAHSGAGTAAGAWAGFLHPLTGLDHLVAMVAIGIWAGLLPGRMRLWPPGIFLAGMVAGGGLAAMGLDVPLVEAGILASVIVLGSLVAAARPLSGVFCPLAGLFGLLHGFVHATETTGGAFGTAIGVLAATALLHGAGVLLATAAIRYDRQVGLRFAGAACVIVALGNLLG